MHLPRLSQGLSQRARACQSGTAWTSHKTLESMNQKNKGFLLVLNSEWKDSLTSPADAEGLKVNI